MATAKPLQEQNSTPEFVNLQQSLVEIHQLLLQLADIYRSKFPKLVPTELLQSTHGFQLLLKVLTSESIQPERLYELQQEYGAELSLIYSEYLNLINSIKTTEYNMKSNAPMQPQFAHRAWHDNPNLIFLRKIYELNKAITFKWIQSIEGINHKTREQLHFYANNFLSMLAPTNSIWTNPEVMESIIDSSGTNLIRGLRNYLDDLVENNGQLNVRMTDLRAFKVGKNLAVTPGKVIYQNDLIQLIQYQPSTPNVYTTPILITPPWINKYYVLDLSPKNSLVKWLVEQGFTVCIISWKNPDANLADKKFEDYMQEGPLAALDVITKKLNVKKVHMVGYCIGGTLLGCTLAYMRQKGDNRALSATFLMSLLDFSDPGEIGAFIDEPQLKALDKLMQDHGYLNGHLLDMTFNLLRPDDLVWPYFVNSYLLGKDTKPFDILYWNADSANLPYKMYSFYLHNMYLHNNLCKPGKIVLSDTPIDLGKIDTPAFFLSSEVDHITLWKSIYKGLHNLSGPVEFVLTESGHVRGVLNPPGDTKYNHKVNTHFSKANDYQKKSSEWLATATKANGSWWPHWRDWLIQHDQTQIPARQIPASSVIEDAPGSYVMKRL
jgi:polyhydroxyalkanoate synthase